MNNKESFIQLCIYLQVAHAVRVCLVSVHVRVCVCARMCSKL